MSAPEIAWRIRHSVSRDRPRPDAHPRPAAPPDSWRSGLRDLIDGESDHLVADAERIAQGELCFWGRSVRIAPRSPDWSGAGSNGGSSEAWRDWQRDLKPGWELHRQQHLVPLAAGGVVAERPEWRRLAGEQMLDWVESNPFDQRPAWSSGYETAHRLIGWAWTLPLIWEDLSEEERGRLWESYALQVEYVRTTPSLYSSANNHRIMELVGLYAASALGASLPSEEIWSDLEHEVERQTYPDGGSREQASGYFLYVLEALWVAAVMRDASDRPLGAIEERLRAMLGWLAATRDSTGEPPPFGDDAEDRAIRLRYFAPRRGAEIGKRVRELVDPGVSSGGTGTGDDGPHLKRDSGLIVIRDREATIVVDVGELGFGSLAAHGHADALSVVVQAGDQMLLRDSGTGSYAPAAGRDEFRLTAAHNSVIVNGESQAVPTGPHLWGERYEVELEAFDESPERVYLRASHDGYLRLPERARHTRSVTYLRAAAVLAVLDRVVSQGAVAATLVWQLSPDGYPERLSDAGGSLDVAGVPEPGSVRRDGPFSPRYGEIASAPRYLWSASGKEVVFASAISLPGSPSTAIAAVTPGADAISLNIDVGDRPMTITEDWSSRVPEIA
jgi:hypothetical protein